MKSPEAEENKCTLLQRFIIDLAAGREGDPQFYFPSTNSFAAQKGNGGELAALALSAAPALSEKIAGQGTIVLAMPYGPDFIASLLACFAANVAVVLLPLVSSVASEQEQIRLAALQEMLSCRGTLLVLGNGSQTLSDFIRADHPGNIVAASDEDIALILLTSGSSGNPKGVLLSHSACWSQVREGVRQWKMMSASRIVSWLSPAHNFGLHFGLLAPLVSGASSTHMRPQDFMRRPESWFETVQETGATHVAAPNFAFDFLSNAVSAQSLSPAALANVCHIVCGGEPVHKSVVERFMKQYAGVGLHEEAFCAHYGLSETGALTTNDNGEDPVFLTFGSEELLRGQANIQCDGNGINLANCGRPHTDVSIRIVNPDTTKMCAAHEVGEIWVHSSGLSSGYLNDADSTWKAFGWAIRDTGEAGFFRTGDRGLLHQGCLYVAGRDKEVIIVRGKNHFPSHIEMTIRAVEKSQPLRSLVFGVDRNGSEEIAVLLEVDQTIDGDALRALAADVRAKVARTHGIGISELAFFARGKLFPPVGGKLNRLAVSRDYLSGNLECLWKDDGRAAQSAVEESAVENRAQGTLAVLREKAFAKVLGEPAIYLSGSESFFELGLDSMQCLRVAGEIETVFGIPFEATLLFKYSTLSEIAVHIDKLLHGKQETDLLPSLSTKISVETAEPIAVIGMHCELPCVGEGVEALWSFLLACGDGISRIAEKRPALWDAMQRYPGIPISALPEWAGLLDDVDTFDAEFFGISRREAECMDPQQRKTLEFIWKLAETSGYDPLSVNGGQVGVFVAAHTADYGEQLAKRPDLMVDSGAYIDSGSHLAMIPNRVSRWFNFTGPSELINTACSSSLVALHHAIEALRRGECLSAMVVGVNLILSPRVLLSSSRAGMLARDGRCKTLDADADGFVRSEGVAGVFLKPLSTATTDGDNILGLIRGVSINHDGRSNSLRAPNVGAQKALLVSAYSSAGIDPATVSYVELHGTGTPLGDPIEMQALREAFHEISSEPRKTASCGVGSIKSNIGHLETAAGVAGLIKVLLAMQHRTLPGALHFRRINRLINLTDTPFHVVAEHTPWSGVDRLRRAGVSSFGFGGVNAHAIVEEYIQNDLNNAVEGGPHLIVLSARTDERLRAQAVRLLDWLNDHSVLPSLADIAWTLQTARHPMRYRIAATANSAFELRTQLKSYLAGATSIPGFLHGQATHQSEKKYTAWKTGVKPTNGLVALREIREAMEAWISGASVDWRSLYKILPRRLPNLPTYAFARERYWIPDAPEQETMSAGSQFNPLHTMEGKAEARTALLLPEWKQKRSRQTEILHRGERLVVLCDQLQVHQRHIETVLPETLFHRAFFLDGSAASYETSILSLIEILRQFSQQTPHKNVLVQVLGIPDKTAGFFEGLSGLLKTARLENQKTFGQIIGVQGNENSRLILEILQENAGHPEDSQIRYLDGSRHVLNWAETTAAGAKHIWRDSGVYLITGGTGRLGMIFAREIASQAKDPVLILTGRSELSIEKRAALLDLEQAGAKVVYSCIDASDSKVLSKFVVDICRVHGCLTGVLHCAGVLRDRFLVNTTNEDVQEVLTSKVASTVALDEATRDLPLEFIALFGSIAGVFGNAGQAAYASGNAFLNSFGAYRNQLVARGQRHGRTFTVSWPLWRDGGMQINEAAWRMLSARGMAPLSSEHGIQAFYDAWATDREHVLVLRGDVEHLRSNLMQSSLPMLEEEPAVETVAINQTDLKLEEKTLHYLQKLICQSLKLPIDQIGIDSPLDSYGIDSIMVMTLTSELEKSFGLLPKTLFFEYRNLRDLVKYFLRTHHTRLTKLFGVEESRMSFVNNDARPAVRSVRNSSRPLNLRQTHAAESADGSAEIAIIGLSGRYAEADNVNELWENLREGKNSIREVPSERWDHSRYFDADKNRNGKTYTKWGGFIDGVTEFDPQFFGISPREATRMDPQERLFLQCVHEAIEDAGYTRKTLGADSPAEGNIGVYVGAANQEYQFYGLEEREGENTAISGGVGSIANRVSYTYNFNGPSLSVDTMCSSSLTAIHLACQSLGLGECRLAIAGGVNLSIHPNKYLLLAQERFASSKGLCESFGSGGDGYVPGEGVGVVLLKPLVRAVTDGDSIYGVIKATAVNHGGRNNGYFVPNPVAQSLVIEKALRQAGIHPRTVSYVEAHGTGTSLGDPIEIAGLTRAFRSFTDDRQFCSIGSIKSNIGHCESAAGIAGVTKILLQMKHGQLAPSLHAETPNPHIDFANSPFVVQRKLATWQRPIVMEANETKEYARIASLSSFGAGGSNAHIVIEEYDGRLPKMSHLSPGLIVLSAKNDSRLVESAKRLLSAIETYPLGDADLADMAYTLQVGRESMDVRLGILANSMAEARDRLKAYLRGEQDTDGLFHGEVKQSSYMAILADDTDMDQAIKAWILKGKFSRLLGLWTNGIPINWELLYASQKPRRISLPSYPFARQRYWAGPGWTGQAQIAEPSEKPQQEKPIFHSVTPDIMAPQPTLPTTSASTMRSRTSVLGEIASAAPAERADMLTEFVRQEVANLLKFPSGELPGLQQGFFDMGMESIVVARLQQSLGQKLELDLPVKALFDFPTISKLSYYLLAVIPWTEYRKPREEVVRAGMFTASLSSGVIKPPSTERDIQEIASELQALLDQVNAASFEEKIV